MNRNKVIVIGAGLAGAEAAWQAAQRGVQVELYEMRPVKSSPAHHTEKFAELVCSNSLRAANIENAVGLLKEEMRRLGSLIMECADTCRVPAGGALAVDREKFSAMVTEKICSHPNITVIREECTKIPESVPVIIASGPLTSDTLAQEIQKLCGTEYFHFFDAAAPIVYEDSIDYSKVFRASRYDKGDADYLNCPMNEAEYKRFWNELVHAECAELKEFDKVTYFEGCMPVEAMAKRGEDTLRFGPLKPVGLIDKRTEETSYAVVQLRQDNSAGTLYNLVGFQTHLKWGEQKRVFRLIPGLEQAEFARFGVMHRNSYINSPKLLHSTLQLRNSPDIFFAGQLTGVEGYLESAAMGYLAGMNSARRIAGKECIEFPKETAMGGLSQYIATYEGKNFQPMNINFGLMDSIKGKKLKKKEKNALIAQRALERIEEMKPVCREGIENV